MTDKDCYQSRSIERIKIIRKNRDKNTKEIFLRNNYFKWDFLNDND